MRPENQPVQICMERACFKSMLAANECDIQHFDMELHTEITHITRKTIG